MQALLADIYSSRCQCHALRAAPFHYCAPGRFSTSRRKAVLGRRQNINGYSAITREINRRCDARSLAVCCGWPIARLILHQLYNAMINRSCESRPEIFYSKASSYINVVKARSVEMVQTSGEIRRSRRAAAWKRKRQSCSHVTPTFKTVVKRRWHSRLKRISIEIDGGNVKVIVNFDRKRAALVMSSK